MPQYLSHTAGRHHVALDMDKSISQVISMWLEGNCLQSAGLYPAHVIHVSQVISMWLEGNCHEFRKAVPRKWSRLGAAAKVAGTVVSPMPGKIIQVISHQLRC